MMEEAQAKIENERGRKAIKKVTDFFSAEKVYLFRNGETIVIYNRDSIYLYNYEESKQLIYQMNNNILNKLDLSFLDEKKQNLDDLARILNWGIQQLDYSMNSVDKLDSILAKMESRGELDQNAIYKPLITYIGEVIMKNTNGGKWEVVHSDSMEFATKDGELVIRLSNKHFINLPQMIKTMLINGTFNRYSLISKVEYAISNSSIAN